MPIYQIQGPDGSIYEIEGPAGAKEQDLISAAQTYIAQQEREAFRKRLADLSKVPEVKPEVKTTFGGQLKEFGKGLLPGAAGLAETAVTGAAALLPEETEQAVRAKAKELAEPIKRGFAAEAGYEDTVGRKLGEALGSTLPFFALAPFGVAGVAAGVGTGVAAGAGEARQRAEAQGVTGDERALATALGIGPGAFDALAPSLRVGKTLITRAFLRGGVEGATEAAQNVAQNLIEMGVYNPEQPLFAGTAEEGAYGAGAGALSSMLVDLVVGRRAKGAAPTPLETTETATTEPLRLGYDQEPFTPIALPDGSVIATRAEFEKYKQQQGERAEDQRLTQQLVRGDLTPEQYELARRGREMGLQETFGEAQPDLFGEILPERAAPVAEVAEPEIVRDTQTRDMIDELETQQLLELQRQVDEAPTIAQAEVARLRFESALAETDARRVQRQQQQTEENRLAVLLPILEDPTVQNFEGRFAAELRRQGFTNLDFTPREQQIINRAYDIRAAQAPEPAPLEVEPSAPADLTDLEGAIPERSEAVEPQQLSFPGMGRKGITAEEVTPEAAPEPEFTTVLTRDVLDTTGLPKQSGFYRQLVDKDLADPAAQAEVADVIQRVRANPSLTPATKQAVEGVAMRAFGALATQAEMFGPRGGVLPTGGASRAKPRPATPAAGAPVSEAGGVGAGVPVQPGEVTTPESVAPAGPGLGTTEQRARKPRAGKEKQPDTLSQEEQDAIQAELAEALAGEVETVGPEVVGGGVERGPQRTRKVAPEKRAEPKPKAATTEKRKAPRPDKTAKDVDKLGFYAEFPMSKALEMLAADIYIASAEDFDVKANKYREIKFGREGTNLPLTGGKYGKAFYESLSDADKKKVLDRTMELRLMEQRANAITDLLGIQPVSTEEAAELELAVSALVFSRLHPSVSDAIDAGDLKSALAILTDKSTGMVSKIAARLANVIGDTKVEFVTNLKNAQGKPVAGLYDPKTDTIKLDRDMGNMTHTLLHEVTHAATSHVLDNPSHPVTQQLRKLYEETKSSLDTAYGTTSLDEFVAEAFSNPTFQQKLASINPKGEALTAWRRFVNIITNFARRAIGLDSKPATAMDSADRLISSILSTAPGTRNAGALYSLSTTDPKKLNTYLNNIAKRAESLPLMDADKVNAFHEFFSGTLPNAVKNIVRQSLPLNALVDVAKKYIPLAPEIDRLVNEKSGKESQRNQAIDPVIDRIEKWAKGSAEKSKELSEVALEASRLQVDPAKDRATYAKDAEKLKDYDRLKPMYNRLGEDGQRVYKDIQAVYGNLYKEIRRVIDSQIDDSVKGEEARRKAKTDINDLLTKRGGLDPYFPFTRSGDYWLSYHGPDGEYYVEAFESKRAREQAMQYYEDNGATNFEKFAQLTEVTYKNAPPTSFINSMLKTLELNKVDATTTEQIIRLYLNTLPATSFAQSFQRRKGTLGYQKDVVGVLRNKTYNISRQLSNMEYAAKFGNVQNKMREQYRESKNQDEAKPYLEELNARIKFAVSPVVPQWSKIATSIGFNMTLGFNVSSALVNLTQIPLVVMPYLGGKYGYSATTKAIGNATRMFMNSGFSREVEMAVPDEKGNKKVKLPAGPSIDNIDFSKDPKNRHMQTLVEVAGNLGQLNRSQMYDILDVDDSTSIMAKINAASGFVFHHGERMNRQIALIAAYNLELDRMRKEGIKIDKAAETRAAEEAIYLTELTNGGVAAAAAPRLAQSGLGKVIFMFKRYGVSMYYMMFKTARQALQKQDPEVRKAAMKQIAGIYGSAAIFAGIQGLPMFGIAAMIYNMFADDDEEDFETAVRNWTGELPYKGLVNAATGLDIASRVGLSDLIFRDQRSPESQTVMLTLMETMGGPVYGVATRVERGLNLIQEGDVARGIEQILPSAAGNVLKAIRYGTEGANTLRGDPILGDLSTANVLAQAFGFAPADYTRQLEQNAAIKRVDRTTNEQRTKLLRKYYIAARVGDIEKQEELVADIQKFNEKHPGAAITASTIIRSMKQHMKTTQEMYHGITISKNMRREVLANINEFDDDLEEPQQ
jgi:hypothetical protein